MKEAFFELWNRLEAVFEPEVVVLIIILIACVLFLGKMAVFSTKVALKAVGESADVINDSAKAQETLHKDSNEKLTAIQIEVGIVKTLLKMIVSNSMGAAPGGKVSDHNEK